MTAPRFSDRYECYSARCRNREEQPHVVATDVWLSPRPRGYGISTWLITCTMPFEAEMSVAPRPAAESCSRVSFEPFSIT